LNLKDYSKSFNFFKKVYSNVFPESDSFKNLKRKISLNNVQDFNINVPNIPKRLLFKKNKMSILKEKSGCKNPNLLQVKFINEESINSDLSNRNLIKNKKLLDSHKNTKFIIKSNSDQIEGSNEHNISKNSFHSNNSFNNKIIGTQKKVILTKSNIINEKTNPKNLNRKQKIINYQSLDNRNFEKKFKLLKNLLQTETRQNFELEKEKESEISNNFKGKRKFNRNKRKGSQYLNVENLSIKNKYLPKSTSNNFINEAQDMKMDNFSDENSNKNLNIILLKDKNRNLQNRKTFNEEKSREFKNEFSIHPKFRRFASEKRSILKKESLSEEKNKDSIRSNQFNLEEKFPIHVINENDFYQFENSHKNNFLYENKNRNI